jgi:hypothetical protein
MSACTTPLPRGALLCGHRPALGALNSCRREEAVDISHETEPGQPYRFVFDTSTSTTGGQPIADRWEALAEFDRAVAQSRWWPSRRHS